jgi:ubiquinone biosynthesis protein COQ4
MFANATIDTRLHPIEALRAVGRLLNNPDDTQQVFAIFRAMRGTTAVRAFKRFAASPAGADLLRRRPSLLATLKDRIALAALPEGSVGRTYLAFVEREHLSADGLVMASGENWDNASLSADMDFYLSRMRDAHDLNHILTGYGRDPLGETCLLAYMYAHTGNRGAAMIVGMSLLKMDKTMRAAVFEAWRNGRKAVWFQNQDFETLLARPLDDVRNDLEIVAPVQYQAIVAQMG